MAMPRTTKAEQWKKGEKDKVHAAWKAGLEQFTQQELAAFAAELEKLLLVPPKLKRSTDTRCVGCSWGGPQQTAHDGG